MATISAEGSSADGLEAAIAWARATIPARVEADIAYGEGAEQVFDLWTPADREARDLIVAVHGGSFARDHTREVNEAMVRGLTAHGFAVANIEYRRIDCDGDFERTTADVAAAVCAAANVSDLAAARLAVVGHSAGGYLAIWSAPHPRVDLAVGLSPLCDLVALRTEGLDDGMVERWMACAPEDDPGAYRRADLAQRPPSSTAIVLMHGEDDDVIPCDHSIAFHRAAAQAGERVDLHTRPRLGHLDWLDVRTPAFRLMTDVLERWCDARD